MGVWWRLVLLFCVCKCVLGLVWQVCTCVCALRPEEEARGLFLSSQPCSFKTVSFNEPRARLAASKPQSSSCLCPSQHWNCRCVQGHTWPWALGIQTQLLMLLQQVLLPTNLSPILVPCDHIMIFESSFPLPVVVPSLRPNMK